MRAIQKYEVGILGEGAWRIGGGRREEANEIEGRRKWRRVAVYGRPTGVGARGCFDTAFPVPEPRWGRLRIGKRDMGQVVAVLARDGWFWSMMCVLGELRRGFPGWFWLGREVCHP